MPWVERDRGGQRLYPGSSLALLALVGTVAAWRHRRRRFAVSLLLGAGVAALLSLGPNLELGGWHPYDALGATVPGLQQLRSPFRLAVFVQVLLLGLAGYGLSWLWQRGRAGHILASASVALGLLEIAAPARLAGGCAAGRRGAGVVSGAPERRRLRADSAGHARKLGAPQAVGQWLFRPVPAELRQHTSSDAALSRHAQPPSAAPRGHALCRG